MLISTQIWILVTYLLIAPGTALVAAVTVEVGSDQRLRLTSLGYVAIYAVVAALYVTLILANA